MDKCPYKMYADRCEKVFIYYSNRYLKLEMTPRSNHKEVRLAYEEYRQAYYAMQDAFRIAAMYGKKDEENS